MYQRILVAADGSPWSDAALAYAIRLASSLSAELRILTVPTTPITYAVPDMMGSSDVVLETVERQSKDLLAHAAAHAERVGVPYEILSTWGSVPETILRTAEEQECDVILLGSRMMTGWKRLMIGNISNMVIAKAHQPVLVVKQPQDSGEMPLPWRRLLVATGGSPWSDAAVDHALTLAQAEGLTVHILYVEPGKTRHPREVVVATSEGKNVLALAEARAVTAGVDYATELAYGHPVEVILDTARRYACDMILLGSRGLRGWKRVMLGSVSNAVAAKASHPVLIIKRFFAE